MPSATLEKNPRCFHVMFHFPGNREKNPFDEIGVVHPCVLATHHTSPIYLMYALLPGYRVHAMRWIRVASSAVDCIVPTSTSKRPRLALPRLDSGAIWTLYPISCRSRLLAYSPFGSCRSCAPILLFWDLLKPIDDKTNTALLLHIGRSIVLQ